MPASALARLAAEVTELHADALEAARVTRLCQVAAGQRLIAIRESMRESDWTKWVRSPACPVPRRTLAALMMVAELDERGMRPRERLLERAVAGE